MRQREEMKGKVRGRARAHWIDGECSNSPRYWMFSGEEFRQPCGDLSEGKKGERQRGSWAIYRHRLSSKRQGIKGELRGSNGGRGLGLWRD
jgi:hypothetical protein